MHACMHVCVKYKNADIKYRSVWSYHVTLSVCCVTTLNLRIIRNSRRGTYKEITIFSQLAIRNYYTYLYRRSSQVHSTLRYISTITTA